MWRDALAAGVNPHLHKYPDPDPPSSLNHDRKEIDDVVELLESHHAELRPSQLFWIITNTDGLVIRTVCSNEKAMALISSIQLQRGVDLSLKAAGVNAISCAMETLHIAGSRGFTNTQRVLHGLQMIASPVFEADGRPRAYVALAGPFVHSQPTHFRLYMTTVLQSLDQRRRLKQWRKDMAGLNLVNMKMLGEAKSCFISPDGSIRFISKASLSELRLESSCIGQPFSEHFQSQPPIEEMLKSDEPKHSFRFKIKGRRFQYHGELYPIRQRGELTGAWLNAHRSQRDAESGANDPATSFEGIIGNSPVLVQAKALATQLAPSDISVLLLGPSGSGKELFAQGIHAASSRQEGPFISLNCGALPRELAESELFGYAPGSFTGALNKGKVGLMESASGGSLFLDEIGDMPMDLQIKLLRVLESQTLTRLGESEERQLNFRLIAATHRDLLEQVEKGRFRHDLYYRIAASTIQVPSLQDMASDIPAIFRHYLGVYCERVGKSTPEIHPSLLEQLSRLSWKGNVRELRNSAEYAAMMTREHAPLQLEHLPGLTRIEILYPPEENSSDEPPLSHPVSNAFTEREQLEQVLEETRGDISTMTRRLGISRATLYRKLQRHRLLKKDRKTQS